MVVRKQLGTTRVNDKNRIYIPKEVINFLNIKIGDFLSFELNEKKQILVFKGHLRFLRNSNSYQPKREKGREEM